MDSSKRQERTTRIPVNVGCGRDILIFLSVLSALFVVKSCSPAVIDEYAAPTAAELGPKHHHARAVVNLGFPPDDLPGTPLLGSGWSQ